MMSRYKRGSGWDCFFFSSRRRHTRFDCDWSSDVCSSDLCPDGWHVEVFLRGSEKTAPRTLTSSIFRSPRRWPGSAQGAEDHSGGGLHPEEGDRKSVV